MIERNRIFAGGMLASLCLMTTALADPPETPQDPTKIAKADSRSSDIGSHPLDAALDLARNGLIHSHQNIADYSATLVKRERINGKLSDYQYMFIKVRNRKVEDSRIKTPFSVYLYFLKPSDIKGREVVYVEGQNNGKVCATKAASKASSCPPCG